VSWKLRANINEEGNRPNQTTLHLFPSSGGQLRRIPFKAGAESRSPVGQGQSISLAIRNGLARAARSRSTATAEARRRYCRRESAKGQRMLTLSLPGRTRFDLKNCSPTKKKKTHLGPGTRRPRSCANPQRQRPKEQSAAESGCARGSRELRKFTPAANARPTRSVRLTEIQGPSSAQDIDIFEGGEFPGSWHAGILR